MTGKQRALPPTYATAADLPEELFERILDFVAYKDISPDDDLKMSKKDLGSCALVCRYWARRCQPRIFYGLVLRSKEDVTTLRAFLDRPETKLVQSITMLTLEQRGHREPWIHLVLLFLRPHLPEVETLIFNLDNPTLDGEPFKSLYSDLPGNGMPRSMSRLTTLKLTHARLRSFRDLMHVAEQLPPLDSLYCEDVTWPSIALRDAHLLPPPRLSSILYFISIARCTEVWPFLRLLAGPRRSHLHRATRKSPNKGPHGNLWLHFTDGMIDTLQGIVQAVGPDTGSVELQMGEWFPARSNQFTVYFRTSPSGDAKFPRILLHLEHNLGTKKQKDDPLPEWDTSPETSPAVVQLMSVDFKLPGIAFDDVVTSDWEAFDSLVCKLPGLRKVVLGFEERRHLGEFLEEKGECFKNLKEKELLKTCYQHREFGWLGLNEKAHAYEEDDVWILEDYESDSDDSSTEN